MNLAIFSVVPPTSFVILTAYSAADMSKACEPTFLILLAPPASCFISKSPLPKVTFVLSRKFKLLSDLSKRILLPFAVIKLTSSLNVLIPETSRDANVAIPAAGRPPFAPIYL